MLKVIVYHIIQCFTLFFLVLKKTTSILCKVNFNYTQKILVDRSYLAYRGLGNSLDWLRSYCIHFIKPYPDNCPLRELEVSGTYV